MSPSDTASTTHEPAPSTKSARATSKQRDAASTSDAAARISKVRRDLPSGWSKLNAQQRRNVIAPIFLSVVVLSAAMGFLIVAVLDQGDPDPPPVRILLIGDSIMNSTGCNVVQTDPCVNQVEAALESDLLVGDVEVINASVNGSGLLHTFVTDTAAGTLETDWFSYTRELVDRYNPDIVGILFVGNYSADSLYINSAGREVDGYTTEFFEAWNDESRELQRLLTGYGPDIYWVNPPPMVEELEERVDTFRDINRGLAEDWTNTLVIDGTRVLSNEAGEYARELPDENGVMQVVRAQDSVHLTPEGAGILSKEIARQMRTSVLVIRQEQLTQ